MAADPSPHPDPSSPSRRHVVCGILMGSVDAVPGVSGGTVALVMGIYDELVLAISRFDRTWLGLLRQRAWTKAWRHIHLPLLLRLASGIVVGLVATLSAVNYLLETNHTRPFTLAVFFGLILASTVLVARMIPWHSSTANARYGVLALAGGLVSYWLTTVHHSAHSQPTLLYLFGSGSIAICAMILPGISGAMVLWILGVYEHLSNLPRALLRGEGNMNMLTEFVVFAVGCLVGLLAFSRLLRYLLQTYRAATIATLCGIMVGALNKLWPFQESTGDEHHHQAINIWPARLDLEVIGCFMTIIVAAWLVLWADHKFRRNAAEPSPATADS